MLLRGPIVSIMKVCITTDRRRERVDKCRRGWSDKSGSSGRRKGRRVRWVVGAVAGFGRLPDKVVRMEVEDGVEAEPGERCILRPIYHSTVGIDLFEKALAS